MFMLTFGLRSLDCLHIVLTKVVAHNISSTKHTIIMSNKLVLVTGASGFIGSHVVKVLLEHGYRVRGTVRDVKNEAKTKPIKDLHPSAGENLQLVNADLMKDDGWNEAVKGCDYVLHLASPFPPKSPRDENELIRPAVDGTLRVLRAASEVGGVQKVVLTSSIVAIYSGHENFNRKFTEADWTQVNAHGVPAYDKSKTLAEKAAWEFVNGLPDSNKYDLIVMNPGLVLGPMLTNMQGTSAGIVKSILTKEIPMVPKLALATIDVRDVALAHVRALEKPEAVGKRFLLASGVCWFKDLGKALSNEFSSQGYSVTTREAPNFAVFFARLYDAQARDIYPNLGISFQVETTRMKEILGITNAIDKETSIIDQAYSLIERGFVNKKPGYMPKETSQHL